MRKVQKQATEQVANLKAQLKVYLKKNPMMAKYAKEPYLTWVLYGVTALTVTLTWAGGAAVMSESLSVCTSRADAGKDAWSLANSHPAPMKTTMSSVQMCQE